MSAASAARVRAGLTVEQAAKISGYSAATVRQCEKPSVGASYRPALRLSALYACDPTLFLKQSTPRARGRKHK